MDKFDFLDDMPLDYLDSNDSFLDLILNSSNDETRTTNHSTSTSLSTAPDINSQDEAQYPLDSIESFFETYLGEAGPQNEVFDAQLSNDNQKIIQLNAHLSPMYDPVSAHGGLRIKAEPNSRYRERYPCESDRSKKRNNRFIRTACKNRNYEYPTVEFSPQWQRSGRDMYIQVTPLTIKAGQRSYHCIHPYPIETPELDTIRDATCNTLYFPVRENELASCEKQFRIIRTKMVQNDLKAYGSLRVYNEDRFDDLGTRHIQTPKQIIATYNLWQSLLVFAIAERLDEDKLPVAIPGTAVFTQVMRDMETEERHLAANNTLPPSVCCAPQQAKWQGGDPVLLVLPCPIKQKEYTIAFDFGQYGHASATDLAIVDRKTLAFHAPPCPLSPANGNVQVPMIISESGNATFVIDFTYVAPMSSARPSASLSNSSVCARCEQSMWSAFTSNKRVCAFDVPTQDDNGANLAEQLSQLSLTQNTSEKHHANGKSSSAADTPSAFHSYVRQLKKAVGEFVRTNDPSHILRRTRTLLSASEDGRPPLLEAIERGHTALVLLVIEQVTDKSRSHGVLEETNDRGESALLVAARCGSWEVVEKLMTKRSDLAEQRDDAGNNVLHVLATAEDDEAAARTIKIVLNGLPSDRKTEITKQTNKEKQTALGNAQSRGNTQCVKALSAPINSDNCS